MLRLHIVHMNHLLFNLEHGIVHTLHYEGEKDGALINS